MELRCFLVKLYCTCHAPSCTITMRIRIIVFPHWGNSSDSASLAVVKEEWKSHSRQIFEEMICSQLIPYMLECWGKFFIFSSLIRVCSVQNVLWRWFSFGELFHRNQAQLHWGLVLCSVLHHENILGMLLMCTFWSKVICFLHSWWPPCEST